MNEISNNFKFLTGFAGGTLLLVTNFVANINVPPANPVKNLKLLTKYWFWICNIICYLSLALGILISLLAIRKIINNRINNRNNGINTKCEFLYTVLLLSIGYLSFLSSVVLYLYPLN